MNEATLKKLEFPAVCRKLSSFCSGALGKRLALSLKPASDFDLVRRWRDQALQLAKAAESIGPPPLAGIADIRESIRATASPTPLEADALATICETLRATTPLCAWFRTVSDEATLLKSLARRIQDFASIGNEIRNCIDARGKVVDQASQKLRSIRSAIEQAHERINGVFDKLLHQSKVTRMLQYHGTTFHHDRVVLPLKAEHRGRIPGIIHRSSDSGATLFVEPAPVVELNNDIIRLRVQEHKEITRILIELSRSVHAAAPAILQTLQAIAVVDLNRAKWTYAKHYHCTFAEIDTQGRLELHDARHPVLLDVFSESNAEDGGDRQVVPIDVRLGDDFDALIITGPNTGGKTVTLKTIGLLAIMAQSGIPIPAAEGSRLPVYKKIFVDIGDEQSLQQSLSTFSSHMSNLLDIMRQSGPGTLVIIDELGAGTDPDEGAAIGRAVVEELIARGAKVVVTTHLSALKAVAYTHPRADNASVEFDLKTLRPTYRVRMGEPGTSNAITIAQRLGMSHKLAQAARTHLEGQYHALDEAIKGTLHSRREAEEARKAAHTARVESMRIRDEYAAKQDELEQQRQSHQRWTQWVTGLRRGDPVYLNPVKCEGKIVRLALQKQTAVVSVGSIEYEVSLAEIQPSREE